MACSFEDDCRSLAFVLKVREPQPDGQSDEEFFAAVSKAVLGRLFDLSELIARRAKLSEDYTALLHAARNARNYIAHEAASDLERLAGTPNGISQWQDLIESRLEDISIGKIIVAVLLSRNSAESKPTKETIYAYPDAIRSWVFQNATSLER